MDKKKLKHFLLPIKLIVSLSLIALLYYKNVDIETFTRKFANLNYWLLAPIFVFLVFNTVISAYKWQLLLKADNIHVPLKSLVISYYIGSFFNCFMPSNIGGDAYRIYDVAKQSKRAAEGFASVFAERFTGVVALVCYGLVFSMVAILQTGWKTVMLAPMAMFALMTLVTMLVFAREFVLKMMRIFQVHRIPKLYQFGDTVLKSIQTYKKNIPLLIKTLSISFTFQLSAITAIYLMGRALTITSTPFIYYMIFIPIIMIVEMAPISIFGVGVRESAYVIFFTQVGMTKEQALSLPLLFLVIALAYSLIGGVLFVLRKKTALIASASEPDESGSEKKGSPQAVNEPS